MMYLLESNHTFNQRSLPNAGGEAGYELELPCFSARSEGRRTPLEGTLDKLKSAYRRHLQDALTENLSWTRLLGPNKLETPARIEF